MLDLVGVCKLCGGNHYQCSGWWTWKMKERRSFVDYILLSKGLVMDRMKVEDSGELNLGSDHDLI